MPLVTGPVEIMVLATLSACWLMSKLANVLVGVAVKYPLATTSGLFANSPAIAGRPAPSKIPTICPLPFSPVTVALTPFGPIELASAQAVRPIDAMRRDTAQKATAMPHRE